MGDTFTSQNLQALIDKYNKNKKKVCSAGSDCAINKRLLELEITFRKAELNLQTGDDEMWGAEREMTYIKEGPGGLKKKVKQKALAMVLSDKVANDKLVLVESYNMPEAKTKVLQTAFSKLPNKNRPTLVVTKNAEENIVKASKNLPRVETINFGSLNLVDLMKKEYLVINKELLKKVSEHYI